MTNQIQGEILFQGINSGANPAQYVYTPWMPAQGDKGTFGIEILKITSSTTIKWSVETRTAEDPTTMALFDDETATATGVHLVEADAATIAAKAKQLVRYRIATGATGDVSKYAILRVLEPSWQLDGR